MKRKITTQFLERMQSKVIDSPKQLSIHSLAPNLPLSIFQNIQNQLESLQRKFHQLPQTIEERSKHFIQLIQNESITVEDLNFIYSWYKSCDPTEHYPFLEEDGLQLLIDQLWSARVNNKPNIYIILILRIIEIFIIKTDKKALQTLVEITSACENIFFSINPKYTEIFFCVCQIMKELLEVPMGYSLVCESLENYMIENMNDYICFQKLYIFTNILEKSTNLIIINIVIQFLITLINTQHSEISQELTILKFCPILETIIDKIEKEQFNIEDCSYQQVIKAVYTNQNENENEEENKIEQNYLARQTEKIYFYSIHHDEFEQLQQELINTIKNVIFPQFKYTSQLQKQENKVLMEEDVKETHKTKIDYLLEFQNSINLELENFKSVNYLSQICNLIEILLGQTLFDENMQKQIINHLSNKNESYDKLQIDIKTLKLEIEKQNMVINNQKFEIDELKFEIQQFKKPISDISTLNKIESELKFSNQEHQIQLKKLKNEITCIKFKLNTHQLIAENKQKAIIKEHDQKMSSLQAEKMTKDVTINKLNQEISKLQEQIEAMKFKYQNEQNEKQKLIEKIENLKLENQQGNQVSEQSSLNKIDKSIKVDGPPPLNLLVNTNSGNGPPPLNMLGSSISGNGPPPLNMLGNSNSGNGPPPLNMLGSSNSGNGPPPLNLLGSTNSGNGPPPLNMLGSSNSGNGPPPLNMLGTSNSGNGPPTLNMLGTSNSGNGPPPLNMLGQSDSGNGPPPLNMLGTSNLGNGPPPLNMLENSNTGNGPPPLNMLGNSKTNNEPPPLNMLGGSNSGNGPPPLNMLGNQNSGNGPPPMNQLGISKQGNGPPPLNLLGNQNSGNGPPPLNLLGNSNSGNGPPPLNLLGNSNSINGPPPMNLLGNSNTGNGPPPLNMLGSSNSGNGPPPMNLLGSSKQGNGPPPLNMLGSSNSGNGPPPMNTLGNGPSSLNMLGNQNKGPPSLNMLGNNGPPTLNMLGNNGPPPLNLNGSPSLGSMQNGPPRLNMGPPQLNTNQQPQQQQPKVKAKRQPKIPMKQLTWEKIPPQQIIGTVWESIDDEKIQFDQIFDEDYSQKVVVTNSKTTTTQVQQVVKISMLSADRQKNIEIVLGKLKIAFELLEESIWSLDQNILKPSIVESIVGTIPTDSEEKSLKLYEGPIEELANPDKYLLVLMNVNGYSHRLISLKFQSQSKIMISELNVRIKNLKNSFSTILSDSKLKVLLEYFLAAGNYLNGTGFRGGASGFKIDGINAFEQIKSNDKKKNLLMALIEKAEAEKGIQIEDIQDFLEALDEASRLPLDQISTDLGEIKKGISTIKKAIDSQTENSKDLVKFKLNPFYEEIQLTVNKFEQEKQEILQLFQSCLKYYCEDAKVASDVFSLKILKFKKQCKLTKQKINQIKEENEKVKKREIGKKRSGILKDEGYHQELAAQLQNEFLQQEALKKK